MAMRVNTDRRYGALWYARLFGAAMLLPALAHCAYVSDEPLIPMRTATSCGPFGGNWSVIQMRDKQPVQSARWTFTQGKAGCRFHSLSLDKASGVALKGDVDAVGIVAALQVRPGVVVYTGVLLCPTSSPGDAVLVPAAKHYPASAIVAWCRPPAAPAVGSAN